MGILSKLNDTPKVVLLIRLKAEHSVYVELIGMDLAYASRYPYKDIGFYKSKSGYRVWSGSSFKVGNDYLRLPDIGNKRMDVSFMKRFSTEDERRESLRNMYESLIGWSQRYGDGKREAKIKIDGDYWFVF